MHGNCLQNDHAGKRVQVNHVAAFGQRQIRRLQAIGLFALPSSGLNDHFQCLPASMRPDYTVLSSLGRVFIALYFTSSTGTTLSTTTRWATLPIRARPIQP